MIDSDIVAVVANKSPWLMKAGGGALEQERKRMPFTKAHQKKLRALAKQRPALLQKTMAEKLGAHPYQVSRWLKKLGFKPRIRAESRLNFEKRLRRLAAIMPPLTQKEIGACLGGISPQLISRWMIFFGLGRIKRTKKQPHEPSTSTNPV